MGTLLLKLASPLQSWGADGRYNERTTRHEPTKSGIIGLLAAALGRRREDPIDDLASLLVGVRVDQPGQLVRDFHTAHRRVYDASTARWVMSGKGNESYVTTRYYLCDAIFVAGIEAPDEKLPELSYAMTHPAFPLFLGRRSCPPACKILIGSEPGAGLLDALGEVPWQAASGELIRRHRHDESVVLDTFCDAMPEDGPVPGHYEDVHDAPISFSQLYREYEWRRVVQRGLPARNPHYLRAADEHDPFAALKEAE